MIHFQDVNIPGKIYNLFSSVKGLPFNFVLKFLTVSTIKSFIRCYVGVMSVSITQWHVEVGIF